MPEAVTVIVDVVAPVFQCKLPVAAMLSNELPQLLETVIGGVDGFVVPGAAMPVPEALLHVFTVAVTL